jgi:hypothetical protein
MRAFISPYAALPGRDDGRKSDGFCRFVARAFIEPRIAGDNDEADSFQVDRLVPDK